jgi:phosphate-selective porin OprO and OprP
VAFQWPFRCRAKRSYSRGKFVNLIVVFLFVFSHAIFPLYVFDSNAQTAISSSTVLTTTNRDAQLSAGFDFGWKEGLRLGYHYKDILKLELGGQVEVDGRYIAANQALQSADQSNYPPLQGWNIVLRSARAKLVGTFYETVEVKAEVEFAQTREFKDAWIAWKKRIPVIGYVKAGNMKEPFSLEEMTGDPEITFMERSLPTQAFSPDRYLGFVFSNTAFNERLTWAAGVFYNTGSLNNVYSGGDP